MMSEVASVPWIQPVFISLAAQLTKLLIGSRFFRNFIGNNGDAANATRCQSGARGTVGASARQLSVARRRSLESASARDSASHPVAKVPEGGGQERARIARRHSTHEIREINTFRAHRAVPPYSRRARRVRRYNRYSDSIVIQLSEVTRQISLLGTPGDLTVCYDGIILSGETDTCSCSSQHCKQQRRVVFWWQVTTP